VDGSRFYVAGRGSDNVLVLDSKGTRVGQPIGVMEGPEGLAVNSRDLYVLNRFAASISVIDLETRALKQTINLFDPTPLAIRKGRKFLYNTHATSGLGHVACGTCHVDARTDRLAWDLGNPDGEMKALTENQRKWVTKLARVDIPEAFHPMKGPMLTQTLQDIIGHEPFHWRGDRAGIDEFSATYRDLQGTDDELTRPEIAQLKAFLRTISFPPNPNLLLNGRYSTNLSLPGFHSLGRGVSVSGTPLPNGNADRGSSIFVGGCGACHTIPSGLGGALASGMDTNGNSVLRSAIVERSEGLFFKAAQFRNLFERTGFNLQSTNSTSGFGFLHDGRVDTLERFVQQGIEEPFFDNDQRLADAVAFLLSTFSDGLSPPTQGAHPAVGRHFPLSVFDPGQILQELANALRRTNKIDVVLGGRVANEERAWLLWPGIGFVANGRGEVLSTNSLHSLIETNQSFVLGVVPFGTGRRLALDRDEDGYFDQDELDFGSDPANSDSTPPALPFLSLEFRPDDGGHFEVGWSSIIGLTYQLELKEALSELVWRPFVEVIASSNRTAAPVQPESLKKQQYFRVRVARPHPSTSVDH
jgi:YVTN family beta-propeller protein